MKVMTFRPAALETPEAVIRTAGIISTEAVTGGVTVVPLAPRGILLEIGNAARAAAAGYGARETVGRLEERHFGAVSETVALGRRGRVLAGLKFEFNLLADMLDGIELLGELSPRTMDRVLAFGERLSAMVLLEVLRETVPGAAFLETSSLIATDGTHGVPRILAAESRERLAARPPGRDGVYVASGPVGSSMSGEITVLGRGGGENAAAAIACGVGASEIVIWSDTRGVMTADPSMVDSAAAIPRMTYAEAMEMTHFGGEFIHPTALVPAMRAGIPVRVRSMLEPSHPGTVIGAEGVDGRDFTGISSTGGISLVQVAGGGMMGVTGVAARFFKALAGAGVNVMMISQASSEHSICAAVTGAAAGPAGEALSAEFSGEIESAQIDEVTVERDQAIVAVVGARMARTPGIAARVFGTLGAEGINVRAVAQGSSELNISIVVSQADQKRALIALHRSLIEGKGAA
jgi:aspartokinase/homoserine dehydrogenase 1